MSSYIISEELKKEIRYILDKSDKHELVYKIDDMQPVELVADFVLSEDLRQAKYDIRKIVEDNWQNIKNNNIKIYIVKAGKK